MFRSVKIWLSQVKEAVTKEDREYGHLNNIDPNNI